MESEIKLIDYLISNGGCDLCAKCVNYTPINIDEDYTPCKAYEKNGSLACRNGMIEYFKNESEL